MKKWYLVIAGLTMLLAIFGCEGSKTSTPLPQAAITEIYALSDVKDVTEFVEIKEVQDRAEGCYVMIYIKSLPQKPTSLEDAINQAKSFTRTILEDSVKINNKYNIDQDVAVWAQLPSKEVGVTVLGHARYEAKRKTYHDFERYESN